MSTDIPEAIPAPPRRGSRIALILACLALFDLATGLALMLTAGEGRVETIRVTRFSMLPESLVGTPDYYVTIETNDKKSVETEGYSDTPIGNGLDFKLPKPLELADVAHIELMDKDVTSDDMRDRVDVRGRVCRGQDYQFDLIGPGSPRRTAGYATLASGASLLVIAAILWVRTHAV